MNRLFAAVLCAVMLLGLMSFGAGATEEEQPFFLRDKVIEEAHDSYYQSRQTAGRVSFQGSCGLMVSHQLYNLGINKRCIVFDGNDHYDYYSALERTSGGYYIQDYSAEEYGLEQALLAVTDNGTRDVQNIMVGFQWTSTVAGSRYGHVVLINGIVGGTVYFMESFYCPLGGAEGTLLTCTIKEFAKYYDKWTTFEGLIHFGVGSYHDVCPHTATDLVVQTRFPTTLRSEPALVGQQGCVRLRSVAAGERLRAIAIYETERSYYYRVETNEGFGFIAAGAVSLLQVNNQGMTLFGLSLPRQMRPETVPPFSGTVTDEYGTLSSVEVCVSDHQGQLQRRELADALDGVALLEDLRDGLFFDLLEPGFYQVDVYASRSCPVVIGGGIEVTYARMKLGSRKLYVGNNPRESLQDTGTPEESRDGWFVEQGTWYCYENGRPLTGWVTHLGVGYYLQSDGSVTTGAQTVDGKELYFSNTGALVTGWLTLDGKTGYRAADGTSLTGWQLLDGKLYCFGDDGVMLTSKEETKDGKVYQIDKNGVAAEKQEAQNG